MKLSIAELSRGIKDIRERQSESEEEEEEEEEEKEEEEEEEENEKEQPSEDEIFAAVLETENEKITHPAPESSNLKIHLKTPAFKKIEKLTGRSTTSGSRKRGPMTEEKKALANQRRKANKAAKLAKESAPVPITQVEQISLTLEDDVPEATDIENHNNSIYPHYGDCNRFGDQ
jgi:hypothetical protein